MQSLFPARAKDYRFRCGHYLRPAQLRVLPLALCGILFVGIQESRAALSLQLPATIIEGSGVLTNAGNFRLGMTATSNVLVTLTSSDAPLVSVPANVTVLTGQSNVTFNLTVGDNSTVTHFQSVTIGASAPGFNSISNTFPVLENDAHQIRFSEVGWLQTTNAGFGVQLYAEDAGGNRLTNFYGSVALAAVGLEGGLPLEPTNSGGFASGQRYLAVQVLSPGTAVRLISTPSTGASSAFNVVPPSFYAIEQSVADALWHAPSQTLLASVPATGGVYSNHLVAINPATGLVTNSYPVSLDPSQLEASPAGDYLYVAVTNRRALQRFDLNTRTAGLKFALDASLDPVRVAYDLAVPPGMPDTVVVAAREESSFGNVSAAQIWRYTGGVATELAAFTGAAGWWLESLDVNSDVLLSPSLVRGRVATGSLVATAPYFPATSAYYRDGQIYDDKGNVYSAGNLALLHTFPGVYDNLQASALAEVYSDQRRVFFLVGHANFGTTFYKLKVYDRDLRQLLVSVDVPGTPGAPTRFLRHGTNGLAYVTGNNQLWFVRPDAILSSRPKVDLGLTLSGVPPAAIVGEDYSFTLSLSNAGPGIASLARITNALPANVTVVQTTASIGAVVLSNSAFTWNVSALAPGANATLNVTLRFGTAGWQTNLTYALGFEIDPTAGNNVVSLPLYVQLPPNGPGLFTLNAASEDILYDPVRDRLLLGVGDGVEGQNNGIAVLDPYRGILDSFTPLSKRPGKLARSDDGQFLYVSLPTEALVRRLTLTNLNQNLEFALGGEDIFGVWYPFYAADLAVVPNNPESLVAWRVRRAGPMASEYGWGIAWFDNGVMRPNVTASGGDWRVEFDPDSGTLFGLNGGDLRRCGVDAGGVTFAENFPGLANNAGGDLEFAAGRFFTRAGRELRTQPFDVTSIYSGSESASLVEPDVISGRVFYLTMTGTTASLKAYDASSVALLGSLTITNVFGTPSSLIRWGTNGLAFRTSSNQLFLVRSPLVPPSASAAVRLLLSGPATVPVASDAAFTVTLTNQGPATAETIWVTNTVTAATFITSTACDAGLCFTNNGGVVWALSNLVAGAQATLTFTAQRSQTGVVTVVSSAYSSAPDPLAQDNVAITALSVGPPAAGVALAMINLPARDLVWSPSLGRLLLTTATNLPNGNGLLLSVNPVTLDLNWETPLGPGAGRMSLAGDESRLYTALAYGVEERLLPSFAFQRRFLLGKTGALERATDLDVLPGLPESLGVLRVDNFNAAAVGICDNGVLRTNLATSTSDTAGEMLEVGNDPARLYVQNFGAGGFRRYAVTATGTTLVDADTTLLPTGTTLDMDWGDGRIYTSVGRVIDPETRKLLGTIPNLPAGSLVRYDAPTARLFFLSPGGSSATLRAYDGPTLLPVGSVVISGAGGSLGSFVRWGTDGFAFTTSSNQLWILRSGLVPTNPPADVAITLAHGIPPHIAGSNLTATILITNAGPNDATAVTWTNVLPTGATVLDAIASQGNLNVAANIISGQIPTLATGVVATVTVTFKTATVGIATNQVTAFSSSLDPAFANNFASALLWIQSPTGLPAMVTLNLPVKDVERDPVRPLLYASLGSGAGPLADSIMTIDPANGDIRGPVRVGSDPGRMAASPDGQFLYVGLDGAGTVQKLALPDLTPISSFSVPQNQRVSNMVVSPINPNLIALRRSPGARLTLHENGVARPMELTDPDLFAFSETSGDLFGCRGFFSNVKLFRLDTGPTGLRLLDGQAGKQSQTSELKSSGGLLFYNRGMVVNPDTMQVRAVMPVPQNSIVEPDVNSGRVFYLTPAGSAWTLRAFDIAQGIEVGAVAVPGLGSAPRRLLRWGADGLALYTTNSQLVILRGTLVPTNPPVDVVLRQTTSALTATTNDTLNFSLQLTNHGPVTAAGVVVTQLLSLPVTNVLLTPTLGSAVFTNGIVTWQAGNLTTGSLAALSVSLRCLQTGTLNASAGAYHNLNDSFWGNNAALTAVNLPSPTTSNVLQLRLSTRELAYDPMRDVLYASTPASNRVAGNLIAVINPASGLLERAFPAGSEPEQLTVSDNAHYLYTSLNGAMGVRRFDLAGGTTDQEFQFGTNDMYFAYSLEARPGAPGMIAASLGSFNFASPYPSTVALYNGGTQLTNQGGTARGLSFAEDGNHLFGYFSPGEGYGFVRMAIGDSGIVSTESLPGFTSYPNDLKTSNGRLYSSSGQVVDPYAPFLIGSMTASGSHTVDSAAGRAYYLTPAGANWELRAFDAATLTAVGTQVVANVQGTPSSLIRCGADRLAFRTSSNQLFIVRSPLVPTNLLAATDLVVSQQLTQDFSAPNETLRFVITLTNRGPVAASNVLLAIKPPEATTTSLQLPQGSVTNAGGNYLCDLGWLAVGQTLQIVLSAVITNTGGYTNFASVSAVTPELSPADNTSLATGTGLFFQRVDTSKRVTTSTRALAYDPVRGRLFASLAPPGTNRIAWFDPETGQMQGMLPVAISPTAMIVTDDAQYLYLAATGTGLVQRVNLDSLTVDLSFTPPAATAFGAMAPVPGNPHAVVVNSWSPDGYSTGVFDDGVARSNLVTGQFYRLLAVSTDGTRLFGYDNSSTGGASPDVFQMSLTSGGLQSLDYGPSDTPWGQNAGMSYFSNRLVFANGNVINPVSWAEETAFTLPYWGLGLAPIPAAGLVAFLTADFNSSLLAHLPIYSLTGRQLLTQFDLPMNTTSFDNLVYCGADRLAFRSANEIIFVRAGAIPSADLVLRATLATNTVMIGETVNLQLVVSNIGPSAVSGVSLTNTLPPGFELISFTTSQGTATTNAQNVFVTIGALGTNGTATLHLTLAPTPLAAGVVTNAAEVFGASRPDAIQFNNRIATTLVVLPKDSDHDGLPDDWELAHSLNPTNAADAGFDSDCDGLSNTQEYQTGTNPLQFENVRLHSARFVAPGLFELRVIAAVGKTYTLESSTNLADWSPLRTFVGRNANQAIQTPVAPAPASHFFRLRTDTNAPLPLLTLLNGAGQPTNAPVIQVFAPPGRFYALQSSTNLTHWMTISNYFGVDCTTVMIDSTTNLTSTRFYRILMP